MKVAIHQPNFLPWIGYFHKIKNSDLFVLLDDVQFERGKSFTSRTKIITNNVENWLTIPVLHKSRLLNINEMNVDDNFIWKKKQLKTIFLEYKRAPFFEEIYSLIESIYNSESSLLIDYNIPLITGICEYLEIDTKLICSSSIPDLDNESFGWDKLLNMIIKLDASTYLSGSGNGSRRYVNEVDLLKNNIALEWQNYSPKTYNQFNRNEFVSNISIIDLLFNYGKKSILFL